MITQTQLQQPFSVEVLSGCTADRGEIFKFSDLSDALAFYENIESLTAADYPQATFGTVSLYFADEKRQRSVRLKRRILDVLL
jgi:hypothetical protein